jgi:hypothetical protein
MSPSNRNRVLWDRRGQALAEFALVLPLLLLILLGLVEYGRMISVSHSMSRVSREGANIASRGTGLDTVLAVVLKNSADIGLPARGGAIVSRIRVDRSVPVVLQQIAAPGLEGKSRIGDEGTQVDVLVGLGLDEGSTHYTVEMFYDYRTITPLPRIVERLFPVDLYDRAVF